MIYGYYNYKIADYYDETINYNNNTNKIIFIICSFNFNIKYSD